MSELSRTPDSVVVFADRYILSQDWKLKISKPSERVQRRLDNPPNVLHGVEVWYLGG